MEKQSHVIYHSDGSYFSRSFLRQPARPMTVTRYFTDISKLAARKEATLPTINNYARCSVSSLLPRAQQLSLVGATRVRASWPLLKESRSIFPSHSHLFFQVGSFLRFSSFSSISPIFALY